MPMVKMAMMMCSTFRLFHSSHTQKPMPTPPVSISAATMTSQAMPRLRRNPVNMFGNAAGSNTEKSVRVRDNLSTRATLR